MFFLQFFYLVSVVLATNEGSSTDSTSLNMGSNSENTYTQFAQKFDKSEISGKDDLLLKEFFPDSQSKISKKEYIQLLEKYQHLHMEELGEDDVLGIDLDDHILEQETIAIHFLEDSGLIKTNFFSLEQGFWHLKKGKFKEFVQKEGYHLEPMDEFDL